MAALDRLGDLRSGRRVSWSRLDETRRWSPLLRPATARAPHGRTSLGELCRVHRGQVTGCNAVWIAGNYQGALPEAVSVPAVTKARELFQVAPRLASVAGLRRVIDLPADLDELDADEHIQVRCFLEWAKLRGADRSYVARHRRAWWAVALRDPAPILCTYMARRPPAFVRNPCGARHLNIAHGLYPRDPLPESVLDALRAWLEGNVCASSGRTYAGGLTKFEPKELERIPIPSVEQLYERAEELDIGGADERHPGSGNNGSTSRWLSALNSSAISCPSSGGSSTGFPSWPRIRWIHRTRCRIWSGNDSLTAFVTPRLPYRKTI